MNKLNIEKVDRKNLKGDFDLKSKIVILWFYVNVSDADLKESLTLDTRQILIKQLARWTGYYYQQ